MPSVNELADAVRQVAYDVHRYHGHGHLEKVYENAMVHRLRRTGRPVAQQHPLRVYDEDGTVIGEYFADMVVDGSLVIELKAVRAIADEHIAQVLGYLRSARIRHGLLINFGSPIFQIRKFVIDAPPGTAPAE